jgi:hypothetical protein
MRSRFALLTVIAVVFAPGWYGQESPQDSRDRGLATNAVAPPVAGEAFRDGARDLKHQLGSRQTKRWRPGLTISAALVAFGVSTISLVILWVVAHWHALLPVRFRLRYRFSRAPPYLQPA